jgi:hypothetical protein
VAAAGILGSAVAVLYTERAGNGKSPPLARWK